MESPLKEETMSNELYEAAKCGNFEYVENTLSDDYLCRKTLQSNNILHLAIRHSTRFSDEKNMNFVRKVVVRIPHLLWEPNVDGNTPFHMAAEFGEEEFVKEVCDELTDLRRLRMSNSMGNTPIHSAIIHCEIKVAIILLEKDPELATIVNDSAEAPLHLAIKYFYDKDDDWSHEEKKQGCCSRLKNKNTHWGSESFYMEEQFVLLIVVLLEKASKVAGWRDRNGLTPLHQAASLHTAINLSVIECMIEFNPQCMEVCDAFGKTILHHLINRIEFVSEAIDLSKKTGVKCLVDHQDHDGNTPIHLAAKHSDFIILELCLNHSWRADFNIRNKEGLSVNYYIKSNDLEKKLYLSSCDDGKASIPMTDETHRILEVGDLFSISKHKEKIGIRSFYKLQDSEGRNIMHRLFLLMKPGFVITISEFGTLMFDVKQRNFLSKQTDKNGDTPAHILAQLNPDIMFYEGSVSSAVLRRGKRQGGVRRHDETDIPTNVENLYPGPQKPNDPVFYKSPYTDYTFKWVHLRNSSFFTNVLNVFLQDFHKESFLQNKKGNTALHEAVLANNYPVFMYLVKQYKEAGTLVNKEEAGKLVNKQNETVLHLLATQKPSEGILKSLFCNNRLVNLPNIKAPPSYNDEPLAFLIQSDLEVDHNFLDDDGLTPIMRAVEAGNLLFAKKLWDVSAHYCPNFKELKSRNGQTFWHLLAKRSKASFKSSHDFFSDKDVCRQLQIKDDDENTALYLAIHCGNLDTAQFFLESYQKHNFNESLLDQRNKNGHTFWHLLAKLSIASFESSHSFFTDKDVCRQLQKKDDDENTALHLAIDCHNLHTARFFLESYQKHNFSESLLDQRNKNGQTFWHLLAKLSTEAFESSLSFFINKDVCHQLKIKDKDENTALHLAIGCRNLDTAQYFLEAYQKHSFGESLLDIRNKMGDTPGDMIGSLPYLTPQFEHFLWMDSTMVGYRSRWGIPTLKMDSYVNAIGVIAALLFTVTFTAAFTVPGGLDQEEGTPLLITISAFQVFLISDVVSMCLSMLVVFCLLSILAARNKKESVKLMDFSITLLITAFFTTHLTFITGLYATLHRVNFWIAIVTLVLGLMLLPFMLRYLPQKFFQLLFQLLGEMAREIYVNIFSVVKDLLTNGVLFLVKVVCGAVHRLLKPQPEPEPEPEPQPQPQPCQLV